MSCHFFIYEKVSQTTYVQKADFNFLNRYKLTYSQTTVEKISFFADFFIHEVKPDDILQYMYSW
jgi:hypothetical protein